MSEAQKNIDSGLYPSSVEDALKRWDAGDAVWSVEMGGIGPGYEQCIQVGVFEILRALKDQPIPEESKERQALFDKVLHEAMDKPENKILSGMSGAQAGAAQNLASKFLGQGWIVMDQVPDRHILVNKTIPQGEVAP